MGLNVEDLWRFLLLGYLLTVALETPVLVLLLSKHHTLRRRLFADSSRALYLLVAETFAPAAECLLFYLAFGGKGGDGVTRRDLGTIVAANVLSFLVGEVLTAYGWFGLFR